MKYRKCTKCHETKSLGNFYRYANGKPMACCISCRIVQVQEYAARNHAQRLAYWREYNRKPERRAKLAERQKSEAGKETKRIWYRFRKLLDANHHSA